MGGGFSPIVAGAMTQWVNSLMSIDPTTGQLNLILGLKTTVVGAVITNANYPFIVHM